MTREQWTAVDDFIISKLHAPDPVLEAAQAAAVAAGLPAISVSAPQGKLLHLLARSHGARNILEVGTLAGYSAIWLGRALPAGGRLVTLELEPKHADVARANLARAGLADVVEVRQGRAAESLAQLQREGGAPFDFVFIDADKQGYPEYFRLALGLTRPGSVLVFDNVIRAGGLIEANSDDERIRGVRQLHELLAKDARISATSIQTVGSKGYDGFTLALVLGGA